MFCRAANVEMYYGTSSQAKDLFKLLEVTALTWMQFCFRDDIDVLIERHEVLLADFLEESRRPTEKVRCQSLLFSMNVEGVWPSCGNVSKTIIVKVFPHRSLKLFFIDHFASLVLGCHFETLLTMTVFETLLL